MLRAKGNSYQFSACAGKVRNLSLGETSPAAQKVLHPDQLVWVIVGDRAKIEPSLRDLGWGDIQFLGADANSLPGR